MQQERYEPKSLGVAQDLYRPPAEADTPSALNLSYQGGINLLWQNYLPFLQNSSGRTNRKNLANLLGIEVNGINGHVLPIINTYLEDCDSGISQYDKDFLSALTIHDFFEDFQKTSENNLVTAAMDKPSLLGSLKKRGMNDFVLATVLTCTKTLNPSDDRYSKDRNLLQSFAYPFEYEDVSKQRELLATECADKLLTYGYIKEEQVDDWIERFGKLDHEKIMSYARKIKLRDRYHSISQDAMIILADNMTSASEEGPNTGHTKKANKLSGVGGLLYIEKTETLMKTMYGSHEPTDKEDILAIPFSMSIDKEEEILFERVKKVISDVRDYEWNIFLNTFAPELERSIRLDGSTRFDHFKRMERTLTNEFYEGEELPLHLKFAILMHDIIGDEIASLYELPADQRPLLSDILKHKYPDIFTPDRLKSNHILYSISVILSAYKFEEAAEAWRKSFQERVKLDKKDRLAIDNALFNSFEDAKTAERFRIFINKLANEEPLEESDIDLVQYLHSKELPMSDVENIVELQKQLDIEGALIAATDCLDNVRHPRPDNVAYVWRDVQELLCFYAPMLDIAGFNSLAYKCYDNAYRWIYVHGFDSPNKSDSDIPDQLVRSFGLAEGKIQQMQPFIEGFIEESEKFFGKGNVRFLQRLKSIGSMARKRQSGKYAATNTELPDSIGFTLVVSDKEYNQINQERISDISLALASYWEQHQGFNLGHTRSSDPAIEIFHRDAQKTSKKYKQLPTRGGVKVEVQSYPKKLSGYEAVHVNMVDPTTGIGFEIKILPQEVQTNAWIEHVIYKAGELFGDMGYLKRETRSNHVSSQWWFGIVRSRVWDNNILNQVKAIRKRITGAFFDRVKKTGLYIVNNAEHRKELSDLGFEVDAKNPYHSQVTLAVTELS